MSGSGRTLDALCRLTLLIGAIVMTATASATEPAAAAKPHVNPQQSTIDELNDRKAVIAAQNELIDTQTKLIKSTYPAFDDKFGKAGGVTIESAERDKFHVTARAAGAFADVARKLVAIAKVPLQPDQKATRPVLLLTESDRAAWQTYLVENIALQGLESRVGDALGTRPKAFAPMAGLYAAGLALSQIAGFTKLFRTDKSVAFTDALIPDEALLDQVAAGLPADGTYYPAAEIDGSMASNYDSDYLGKLNALLPRRAELVAKGDAAKDLLKEVDDLATRLVTQDATSKVPLLLTVLRGELAGKHASLPGVLVLSVKVVSKGGTSLKTSSIWRGDRLYASGGLIASYRLADGQNSFRLLKAGIVSSESGFVEVPLK